MGGKTEQLTVTQTATQTLSPEAQKLMGLAMPHLEQYAAQPLQQFQGSGIVDLNQTEKNAAAQMGQQAQVGGQLASQAAGAQSKLLNPSFMLDVANNPYLQAANQVSTQQITQNLNENILPQVRSGATQAGGMYSGGASRQGIAEGQAVGRTSSAISNEITKANYDAYTRGLSGMQQAVSANPGVQAQQLFEPGVMSAIGGQERALEQAKLDEQIRRFYTGQALPFLRGQELAALAAGLPGGTTTGTTTGAVPQGPGKLKTAGGMALAGAGAGAAFGPVGAGIGAAGGGLLGYLTG